MNFTGVIGWDFFNIGKSKIKQENSSSLVFLNPLLARRSHSHLVTALVIAIKITILSCTFINKWETILCTYTTDFFFQTKRPMQVPLFFIYIVGWKLSILLLIFFVKLNIDVFGIDILISTMVQNYNLNPI